MGITMVESGRKDGRGQFGDADMQRRGREWWAGEEMRWRTGAEMGEWKAAQRGFVVNIEGSELGALGEGQVDAQISVALSGEIGLWCDITGVMSSKRESFPAVRRRTESACGQVRVAQRQHMALVGLVRNKRVAW